jgi:hypothetical protein
MLQKINIKLATTTLLALALVPGIEFTQLGGQFQTRINWTQAAVAKSNADAGDTYRSAQSRKYWLSSGNGMFAMCLGLGSLSLVALLAVANTSQSSARYSNRGEHGAIAYRQNLRD